MWLNWPCANYFGKLKEIEKVIINFCLTAGEGLEFLHRIKKLQPMLKSNHLWLNIPVENIDELTFFLDLTIFIPIIFDRTHMLKVEGTTLNVLERSLSEDLRVLASM